MEIFRLIFSPIDVNTYIVADSSGKCAVIDCGCYNESEFGELTGFLEKKNLEPVLLLNTHCHIDHVFGNGMFLKKYGLRTYCHINEEGNRKNSVMHAQIFGLKMDVPPEPEGFLDPGQETGFGKIKFIALFVPGHTSGSLAFYSRDEGVVFTGDALFSGSIGRTDLPGGSYDTLQDSIRNRLFVLPPATIVYPGHGEYTTIEKEIRTNPYFENAGNSIL